MTFTIGWSSPMAIEKARTMIKFGLPPSPPWTFHRLGVDVTLLDDNPVTTWSVDWGHTSGAYGTCSSPTVEGLIEQIAETVRQVERLSKETP